MSDQIAFGFWREAFGSLNILYIDPLVMPIPAIEAKYGITIPIHTVV
ncbi:MAG: hypothetical protein ABGX43_02405 [Nitrospinaceae bacterium]